MIKTFVCRVCLKEKNKVGNSYRNPAGEGSACGNCRAKYLRRNNTAFREAEHLRNKSEGAKQAKKKWQDNNKDKNKEYRKKYRALDPEKYRKSFKDWYDKNKNLKTYLDKKSAYFRRKDSIDPQYRLAMMIRKRTNSMIRNNFNSGKIVAMLGVSWTDFSFYLESKFKDGMSFKNYGQWQIDHIKPLSSFDLTNSEEFFKAANYSNIQPLWVEDHLEKTKTEIRSNKGLGEFRVRSLGSPNFKLWLI